MIEIPRDAPGSIACGRSGLPLLAVCPAGHRRTVPFRLLKTSTFALEFAKPNSSPPAAGSTTSSTTAVLVRALDEGVIVQTGEPEDRSRR
jgi:hypothetical protein